MNNYKLIAGISVGVLILAGIFYNMTNKDPDQSKEASNSTQTTSTDVSITPISHASLILKLAGKNIYADPVGETTLYKDQPEANIIILTDIHGDHLSPDTLKFVTSRDTTVIMPQAVKDSLKEKLPSNSVILNNGESTTQQGIKIEAVPMYNVPESTSAPHTKGRGNGYILEAEGKRIYIAGDTGPITEMKNLKNIDIALVPMNLPYTMSVEQAAEAVIAMNPKKVIPYHYRNQDKSLSDTTKFKNLVQESNPNIQIELLNFYPEQTINNQKPVENNSNELKKEILKQGNGAVAKAGDTVEVHYTGWLTDGKKFDSSVDRGQPFSFHLGAGEVIKGWDDGVSGMKVGEKVKLTIPYSMAYGENGYPPVIPAKATLIFEIELLKIN